MAFSVVYRDGRESALSDVAFHLHGNVVGRDNVSMARVDGIDLGFFALRFGIDGIAPLQILRRNQCPDVTGNDFVIPNKDDLQIVDFDGSGRIDGRDLFNLAVRFGNATR